MNTLYVLRIIQRRDGAKIEGLDGMYVQYYNPRVDWDMQYTLIVCDTPHEARVFVSQAEAMAYYQQVCPNAPTLPNLDGDANRPLTSFHAEIVPIAIREP
jgi:hypothetical protein